MIAGATKTTVAICAASATLAVLLWQLVAGGIKDEQSVARVAILHWYLDANGSVQEVMPADPEYTAIDVQFSSSYFMQPALWKTIYKMELIRSDGSKLTEEETCEHIVAKVAELSKPHGTADHLASYSFLFADPSCATRLATGEGLTRVEWSLVGLSQCVCLGAWPWALGGALAGLVLLICYWALPATRPEVN
jgi:hypothetical protein